MSVFYRVVIAFFLMKLSYFSFAESISATEKEAPRCVSMTLEEFKVFVKDTHRPVSLVFFSTWCADCKPHLQGLKGASEASNVILIHTFRVSHDEEAVLKYLGVSPRIPCINDDSRNIAKSYAVQTVPAEVLIP